MRQPNYNTIDDNSNSYEKVTCNPLESVFGTAGFFLGAYAAYTLTLSLIEGTENEHLDVDLENACFSAIAALAAGAGGLVAGMALGNAFEKALQHCGYGCSYEYDRAKKDVSPQELEKSRLEEEAEVHNQTMFEYL